MTDRIMRKETADLLKMLAETYLKLLIYTRSNPSYQADATLAKLRDDIASIWGAEAEYVQNSFELVADVMRQ